MSSKPAAPNAEEAPKKGKGKLLIIIGLVLALAGGGGGAYVFLKPGHDEHAEEKAKPKAPAAPPVFLTMDVFTVNLQPTGRFLQTTFSLQIKDAKTSDEFKAYLPMARGKILILLSSKTDEEMLTVEGKAKLADEILEIVRTVGPEGQEPFEIQAVLFNTFVIQ